LAFKPAFNETVKPYCKVVNHKPTPNTLADTEIRSNLSSKTHFDLHPPGTINQPLDIKIFWRYPIQLAAGQRLTRALSMQHILVTHYI
jgi:hypothetical protein